MSTNNQVEYTPLQPFSEDRSPSDLAFLEEAGIPPLQHFINTAKEQLEKVLIPRPFIRPIVRQRKKKNVQPTHVPVPISEVVRCSEVAVPTTSSVSAEPTSWGCAVETKAPAETTCLDPEPSIGIIASSISLADSKPNTSQLTCTFYSGSDLISANTQTKPKPKKLHTAKKSTASKRCVPKIEDCKVVLLDLTCSNLRDVVKHLGEVRSAELKSRTGLRSESIDSGLVTDEEHSPEPEPHVTEPIRKTVPPLKLSLPISSFMRDILVKDKPNTVKRTRQIKQQKEESPKRKKTEDVKSRRRRKSGGVTKASQNEESRTAETSNPSLKLKRNAPKKKPQPPRSKVPRLKIVKNTNKDKPFRAPRELPKNAVLRTPKPRSHYLLGSKSLDVNCNSVNIVSLPADVIATSDFNLSKIEISPLYTKRLRDPPPLAFLPYDQTERSCCISCNKTFSTKQELGRHTLVHHRNYNY